MDRHRIEIEFDADIDDAQWVRRVTELRYSTAYEKCGISNVEVSMTPVVVDTPSP